MTDSSNIMSIRELIDAAFGDPNMNVVHHKMIQTILIILARQLRLLERRVKVEIGPLFDTTSSTSLSVTEIKMHANVSRKKKIKPSGVDNKGKSVKTPDKTMKVRAGESPVVIKSNKDGRATEHDKKTEKSTDKSSTSTADKSSSEKTTSGNTARSATSGEDYKAHLDRIEEMREKEIRVIHQRADSREERDKIPTPIASIDSMEKQYEKLLVVERVPTKEARLTDDGGRIPRLSIVTLEEFEELANAVHKLQGLHGVVATAGFPDNTQLLNDLRKGASLTDAMAALQLSARMEAAEKTLEKMLSLVTDLASNIPSNIHVAADIPTEKTVISKAKDDIEKETEVIFDTQISTKSTVLHKTKGPIAGSEEDDTRKPKDWITAKELEDVMEELNTEFINMVNTATARSNNNANNALKIAGRLETKLSQTLNLGNRMIDLEKLVSEYAEQINALDTGLSSQMTYHQEQLTQMQHELEAGIEAMQEALANTGGDTAAVTELNNNFTNLQMDFEIASMRQKDLRDIQDLLTMDIQSLWKQIELLRDTKSDRDEVTDALKDKAGLAALNGLVSRQEFDAVRGDLEKRIGSAYDTFNNQEIIWQKAIDELIRELNEKADWIQVESLQDSIKKYLEIFQDRINAMMEIVGEPRAAAISKKLHRDAACLSCALPAKMDLECKHKQMLPAFQSTRPAPIHDKVKPSEDGDHEGICYPGLPIPHLIHPRSQTCNRYCGGSHTMVNNSRGTSSRVPAGMIISPALHQVNTEPGSDGKMYMVDELKIVKPCLPCNLQNKRMSAPREADPAPHMPLHRNSSNMTPPDYIGSTDQYLEPQRCSIISTTPPAPFNED